MRQTNSVRETATDLETEKIELFNEAKIYCIYQIYNVHIMRRKKKNRGNFGWHFKKKLEPIFGHFKKK